MRSIARTRRRLSIGAAALLVGCHGSSSPQSTPSDAPTTATLGGLAVRIEPDPLRISVTSSDGRVLFDGVPGADVAAPDETTDPPTDVAPRTAIAVRALPTTQVEMYGAFQITETPSQWRSATKAKSIVTAASGITFNAIDSTGASVASVAIASPSDGEIALTIVPTLVAPAGSRLWTSIAATCVDTDRFAGFGQQQRDVEFHGETVPIFVSEPGVGKLDDDSDSPLYFIVGKRHASEYPAPIFLGSRGYVGAIDGTGRAFFSMCSSEDAGADVLRVSSDVTGQSFVYRLFDGPSPKQALGRSTARFGRPRMPPRIAFAPWNDAIFGQDNVLAIAASIRSNDIPSSLIWTEDFRGGTWNGDDYSLEENWLTDTTLYPDLPTMISTLRNEGFSWMAYYNTFVEQDADVAPEANGKYLAKKSDGTDYIFTNAKQKPSGMVDLTSPDASAWVTQKLHDMLAMGAAGWMGDFGEWLPLDATLADGSDAWDTHEIYPQLWDKAQRAALDATDLGPNAAPQDEILSFVRSGWLGSPPLADVVWGGDQRTDMEADDGMPTVLPMGVGMSIVGVSTFGSDIGGYQCATNPPTTKEVFFRWTEIGAFSPVMRTHHTTEPKLSWQWNGDADTIAHFRRYAIQHQQLMPTLLSLANEATATGVTIWRPAELEFPDDLASWSLMDEIMVGPSLLIAPVEVPGATSRSVYFPAGARWYPWWPPATASAAIEGGTTATIDAEVTEIPVFLREGGIVVELPDQVRTALKGVSGVVGVDDVGDDRVVVVAAGPDTTFSEVGGLSYAWSSSDGMHLTPSTSATWNGTALMACDTAPSAPCVSSNSGRLIASVTGPGTLAVAGATLTATGGSATRALTLDLRGDP